MDERRPRSAWWLVVLAAATLGCAWWALTRGSADRPPAPHGEGREAALPPAPGEERSDPRYDVPPGPRLQPASDVGTEAGRGSLAIGGRILRAGAVPAAGAEVWAERDAPGRPVVARAVASADGAYRLEGLDPGLHYVGARVVEGDAQQTAEGIVRAGTTDFDLTLLRRGPFLEVSIVDPGGAPVPVVRLLAVRDWTPVDLGDIANGLARIRTDPVAHGPRLPTLVGAYLVAYDPRDVHGRGLALAPARIGPLESDRGRVELRLGAGPLLRAEVVPPEGRSLESLEFKLMCPHDPARPTDEPVGGSPGRWIPEGVIHQVPADGRIAVAALRPGRPHTISILTGRRHDLLPSAAFALAPDGVLPVIQLRAAVEVVVIVEGPDGRRIPGIQVILGADQPSAPPPPFLQTLLRNDGAHVLRGLDPEARYRLLVLAQDRIHAPGRSSERYEAADFLPHLEEAWRPRNMTVRPTLGLRIEGVVRDAAGTPVVGASVRDLGDTRGRSAVSDAEGRFTLRGLGPGVYELEAWPPRAGDRYGVESGAARARVEAGSSAALSLPRRRRATVVLPEALRSILEEELFGDEQVLCVRRRTPDGWTRAAQLSFEDVPESIEVGCLGEQTEYEFLVCAGDGGYWGGRLGTRSTETRLEHQAGGTIRVVLTNSDVRRHDLFVSADDDSIPNVWGWEDVRQPDGSVLLRGLPEGVYTVTAETYSPARKAQAVARPGETVTLTLEPAAPR